MGRAVAAADADPSDHAYLVDRVRVAKGEAQVYGTQWGSDARQGRSRGRRSRTRPWSTCGGRWWGWAPSTGGGARPGRMR